ncbi:response regulator transcription factor [Fastidiosibacter lacustris]|uniref:response regulator transcription factor n=1 Tax=Fastidiosibacter lacustris TaxID=2056695 RepID=UPI000E352C6D|nr:response regulator transcription factor [Fastidiosibacter lacustris]
MGDRELVKNNILIVGVDKYYVNQLSHHLKNCQIIKCNNVLQLDKFLITQKVDLLVVSSVINGALTNTLCYEVYQSRSELPIIVISDKSDIQLEVMFYQSGIIDYVDKGTDIKIVSAKISAILRILNNKDEKYKHIFFNDICLDIDQKCLIDVRKHPHKLSLSEFLALSFFLKQSNKIVSRDELSWCVYDRPYDGMDRTIDVLISKLRKKLSIATTNGSLIKTVNRAGYMFCADNHSDR